jgi:hypothetical protein
VNPTGQTNTKIDQIRRATLERWDAAWELIRANDRANILQGGGPADQRAHAELIANYTRTTRWHAEVTRR